MDSDIEDEKHKREEWLRFLKKARDFRKERLDEIEKGGVWEGRTPGPYCILHCIPMPFVGQQPLNIESISKDYESFIVFKENRLIDPPRQNQNGLLIETNYGDRIGQPEYFDGWHHYYRGFQRTQIFHTGALEAVYAPTIEKRKGKETNYLSLYAFEFFHRQIKNYIEKVHTLRFSGAVVIGLSILGAKGYSIYTPIISARYLVQLPQKIPDDADEVLNSADGDIRLEMRIEDIQEVREEDIDEKILRPIFDLFWHDFGFFECDRKFSDGLWNLQP